MGTVPLEPPPQRTVSTGECGEKIVVSTYTSREYDAARLTSACLMAVLTLLLLTGAFGNSQWLWPPLMTLAASIWVMHYAWVGLLNSAHAAFIAQQRRAYARRAALSAMLRRFVFDWLCW